ncbi:uncharacterized protein A4U43_UnF8850 [Asparagus officinalis]|uniref:Uncharacterized protein n=1 Tax=Asparagus officinalis TaxID=4686 RepID=A0A1R3L5U6_ASPOF|nr:uncharacterized protein A4U43_UnF8850 [Asparagus officinalis]
MLEIATVKGEDDELHAVDRRRLRLAKDSSAEAVAIRSERRSPAVARLRRRSTDLHGNGHQSFSFNFYAKTNASLACAVSWHPAIDFVKVVINDVIPTATEGITVRRPHIIPTSQPSKKTGVNSKLTVMAADGSDGSPLLLLLPLLPRLLSFPPLPPPLHTRRPNRGPDCEFRTRTSPTLHRRLSSLEGPAAASATHASLRPRTGRVRRHLPPWRVPRTPPRLGSEPASVPQLTGLPSRPARLGPPRPPLSLHPPAD